MGTAVNPGIGSSTPGGGGGGPGPGGLSGPGGPGGPGNNQGQFNVMVYDRPVIVETRMTETRMKY